MPSSMIRPASEVEHAVADAPGLEVREAVGVEAIEEGARLGAADDELAQRRDVDEPRALVDGQRLGLRVAVVVGAAPVAGPHDARAELAVAGMDGRALGGLDRAAGQRAERDRRPRRARGRGADPLEVLAGLLGHEPHGGQLAHAPLAGAHGRRRVALGELDRVIALVDAQVDVLGRDVLAQAREALPAPGAGHGRGHGLGRRGARRGPSRRRRRRLAEAQRVGGLRAGALARGLGVVARAGDRAGREHAVGQLGEGEVPARRVVGGAPAGLRDERGRRRHAARHDQQVALDAPLVAAVEAARAPRRARACAPRPRARCGPRAGRRRRRPRRRPPPARAPPRARDPRWWRSPRASPARCRRARSAAARRRRASRRAGRCRRRRAAAR